MTKKCTVYDCPLSKIFQKDISFFGLPKDPDLRSQWTAAVGRFLKPTSKFCELHFADECLQKNYEVKLKEGIAWCYKKGKVNLNKGSIPTLFSNHGVYRKRLKELKLNVRELALSLKKASRQQKENLMRDTDEDSISDVNEDSISDVNEDSIFDVNEDSISEANDDVIRETNENSLEETNEDSIDETNENFIEETNEDSIDETNENFIEETNEDCMMESDGDSPHGSDGHVEGGSNVGLVNKTTSELRNLTTCSQELYSSSLVLVDKTKSNEMSLECKPSTPKMIMRSLGIWDLDVLKENINLVTMPNKHWNVSMLDDAIIFMRWNEQYAVERRVIISANLYIKIFFKDTEVKIKNLKRFSSVADLLAEVNNMKCCGNILEKKKNKICDGIVTRAGMVLCDGCSYVVINKNYKEQDMRRRLKVMGVQVARYRKTILRFKRQVNQLKMVIKMLEKER